MFLWGFALWDIFSRRDLRGWEKGLWAVAIVLVPLLGMLVYFIARPKEPEGFGGYSYAGAYGSPYGYGGGYRYPPEYEPASGPRPAVNDMETLGRLHESGTLSDEEYDQLKERMTSQQRDAA
jgi:hypothetical protein